jgi:hypothetical protein
LATAALLSQTLHVANLFYKRVAPRDITATAKQLLNVCAGEDTEMTASAKCRAHITRYLFHVWE